MKTIRTIFLGLFCLNVLFIVFSLVAAQVGMLYGQIDDWSFSSPDAPVPPSYAGLGYLLAAWLSMEFLRSLYLGWRIAEVGVVLLVIAVLSSVAGPMIGSITDQGRAAADRGFSTGGAKDVTNFRANLREGHLPKPTDLTFEGLFYDYFFETGRQTALSTMVEGDPGALFSPTYSCAVSRHPLSGKDEYYLSVGLDSQADAAAFARKRLNLVVVLDVSASMNASFREYYYDRVRTSEPSVSPEDPDQGLSKIEVACRSIVALTTHLAPEDRFGLVLFDDDAYLAKPLREVRYTDMTAIRQHILEIRTGGGTNMEAGLREGGSLLERLGQVDRATEETRVIFLTDAMPNRMETGEEGLLAITRDFASRGIFLTFVGIGIDFNTELVEAISKIRGSNYYSVHTSREFKKRLDDEFDLMVNPLVFDLRLILEAEGWQIERVFGSPEANRTTGQIMYVNTLFPSMATEKGVRGGIVLLKLSRTGEGDDLRLTVSYEDRSGKRTRAQQRVIFPTVEAGYFAHQGVRKGVLLARYGEMLQDWLREANGETRFSQAREMQAHGLNKWERTSQGLAVNSYWHGQFTTFLTYLEQERRELGDATLDQEISLLRRLTAGG